MHLDTYTAATRLQTVIAVLEQISGKVAITTNTISPVKKIVQNISLLLGLERAWLDVEQG